MKSRFWIPFVVCLVLTFGSAGIVWGGAIPSGNNSFLFTDRPYEELFRMDETATALYTAANTNNRQLAFAELQKLKRHFNNEMLRGYGTLPGWLALEQEWNAIEHALASGVKHSLWIEHAVRIRLGTDSLIAGNQALWLQYEKLLLDDIANVRQTWRAQSSDPALASAAMLQGLEMHATRIEAAASFSGDTLRMEELSERIRYTKQLLLSKNKMARANNGAAVESSIHAMENAINGIFSNAQAVSVEPIVTTAAFFSPVKWAFFLGTFISAVLSWTGWRKYKQRPYGIKKTKRD
ncbi:sporulation protein YpjB [Paenibacillus sp. GCM10027627]|uniref:sporulation protein YpjB n=1 Tax=unclassified Paenibacillus TaxID=185978 RepID=UPI00363DE37B